LNKKKFTYDMFVIEIDGEIETAATEKQARSHIAASQSYHGYTLYKAIERGVPGPRTVTKIACKKKGAERE